MTDPNSNTVRGNPAFRLLAYLAATLLLGALLAPLLFKLGHTGALAIGEFRLKNTPPFGYLHKVATESDFKRYFNRAVLLAGLACLWPAARWLGVRRADFAPGKGVSWIRDIMLGFALAAGSLLAMGVVLELCGVYDFREEIRWGKSLQRAFTTGFGVSFLEEFFFRGALFALLLRSLRQSYALWLLSAIFAAVHFLKPPDGLEISRETIHWTSGFWLIGQIFKNFGNTNFLLAEFATLLAVGLVLGRARLRTGALWLPIGLHAGWVFGIFLFRGMASASKMAKGGEHLPWIGENLRTGLVPLVIVVLTGVLIHRITRSRKTAQPA